MYKVGQKVKVKVMTDVVIFKTALIVHDCMFNSCNKNLYIVQFDDGTCDNAWDKDMEMEA